MRAPSGDQYVITAGSYRAVVTESGAALRSLTHDGRDLVDGFEEHEMSSGGRGQVLVPWPNRIRDGRYSFGGADHQLPLTEPKRHNASHGLARWVAWSVEEHTAHSVTLGYRLLAQTGYPWSVDLTIVYDLCADGLTVTQTATNTSPSPAPYASGAHPYLAVGPGPVDRLELTLPADVRLLSDDERLLPVGREPVDGTAYDFRVARPLRDVVLNHAFTGLRRDGEGTVTTVLRDPATGLGVALWADEQHPWLLLYTADDVPGKERRSVAVEPMTAPPDAFRSGEDLRVLGAADSGEEQLSTRWGIRALD